MNNPPLSSIDGLSYEQAFSELESIIAALEDENHSLEESLALFERGQVLAKFCTDQLDQAELKVKQLLGGELVDFRLEGE